MPTDRTDQAWKVTSLVEDGGLTHLNLFNLDFERDEKSPRWGTAWIASSEGLHEYDGYTWRRHGRAQGLPSDFVRCVRVTRAGTIWVGTDKGAGVYDGKTFRTLGSETNLAGPNVRRICEDADGTLWFCSDSWPNTAAGGGLTSFREGKWQAYREADGLPSGYVVNYFRDSGGRQFAATLKGLAELKAGRWEPAFPAPADGPINWASGCLAETPGTGLVYSTGNQLFALRDGAWRRLPGEVPHEHGIAATPDGVIVAVGRPNRGQRAFMEWTGTNWLAVSADFSPTLGYTEDIQVAPDGSVWVAGYDCLVRWTRRGAQWREFADLPPPRLVDAEGGVWFADRWRTGPQGPPTVRLSKGRWSRQEIAFDELVNHRRDNSVWGWAGNHLSRWQGTNRTDFTPAQTGLESYVAGHGDNRRSFWLLGRDARGGVAVARHADNRWQPVPVPELAGLTLWSYAAGSSNGVWFAGDRGVGTEAVLVRVGTNGNLRLAADLRLVGPMRMKFREDRHGAVWLYGDAGLFRWVLGKSTAWDTLGDLPARAVVSCVERGNELWFGFSGATGGESSLVALRNGVWTNFPVATLGNLTVASDGTILADGIGQIFRVANQPDAVPRAQGLRTPEAAQAVVQDQDGNLWVGSGNDTYRFRSDRVPLRTLLAGDRLVHADDDLTVNVTALDRFNPGGGRRDVLCAWRLVGGEWQPSMPEPQLRIPAKSLKIGPHWLEVRCEDPAGQRTSEVATFNFEVIPVPLQQRPWFVPALLALAALMTTLALLAANARRRLAEYARLLKQKVADRTAALEADVRRRQQIEENLRASEERFSKAFHSSPLIEVITTYPDGRYVDVNATFVQALGYSREEVLGRHSMDLGIWWDPAERAGLIRRLEAGETVRGLEISQRTKAGERMLVEASFERIVVGGQPCILAINVDITARKQAEAALRAKDELLRLVIDLVPHFIFAKDARGRFLFANQAVADSAGRSPAQLVGLGPHDLHRNPAEAEAFVRDDLEVIASGRAKFIPEETLTDSNGRVRIHQTTKIPFRNPVTGEMALLGTAVDITAVKAAAAALRDREEQLRLVTDNARVGLVMINRDHRYTFANAAYAEGMELPAADLAGRRVAEVLGPLYEEQVRPWLERGLAGERVSYELRRQTPQGLRHFTVRYEPQNIGVPTAFVVVVIADITALKQAEALLQDSEANLSALVTGMRDGLLVADIPTRRFVRANDAMCRMLGYSREELLALSVDQIHPPEALAWVLENFRRQATGELHLAANSPVLRKDGSVFLADISTSPLEVAGRHEVVRVFRDVTERQAAAAALVAQEEFVRDILNSLSAHIAVLDSVGTIVEVNEAWNRFARSQGVRSVSEVGVGANYLEACQRSSLQGSEDAERAFAGIRSVLAGESRDFHFEYLFDGPSQRRWFQLRVSPLGGPRKGVVVAHLDITDRRREEGRRDTEHAVTAVLAGAATLAAVTPALLRALCETEAWEFGELWQVDVAQGKLVCVETWCKDEVRFKPLRAVIRDLRLEPGQGLPGRAWELDQPVSVADLVQDPLFLRQKIALVANLRSAIAFPVRAGGKVIAVMAFLTSRPTTPDPAQLEMLTAIGNQIGQFIARKAAQEELRRFVALSPTVLYALRITPDGFSAFWVSDNILDLTGFTAAEALGPGWWREQLHPEDRDRVLAANGPGPEQDNPVIEFRFLRKDGSHLWLRDERRLVRDVRGSPAEIIGSWSDVSDRMTLEKQLRQSQKMEAIGQLSGGIAHDFNNLLGAIIGNCELARMDLETTHPAAESVDQILTASRRAAQLVEQILTFARVERAEHRRINPLPVVEESVRLLRSTLPAGVQLALLKGEELPAILADETQLQQVLINLGTNAWHALEGRAGRISVELSAETVDATLAAGCPDLHPGNYLRIRVEDTGQGMSPEVLERIFEPFFTTKEVGKGTGLGLSVVHGIMRSHGGAIAVQSAVGVGTTFDLFLPAAEAEAGPAGQTREIPLRMGHGEQLLLVDDQPEMLRTNRRGLERLGYRVLACANSAEALARFEEAPADFALLLTDLNMPGLNGVELARAILRLRPELPVILSSGYITEDLRLAALGAGVREVLRKPATLQELSDAVARHLSPNY